MQDEFAHVIAYGVIAVVLVFWPKLEHATACACYGGLFVHSAMTLLGAIMKKLAIESEPENRNDLRTNLPFWPLAKPTRRPRSIWRSRLRNILG